MTRKAHPTRQKLLDTVLALMDENPAAPIAVDTVLSRSGVSKGSLYHHFEDFSDLVETATASLFVKSVDENIAIIRSVVDSATNVQELLTGLATVTRVTQSAEMRSVRFRRARVLAQTEGHPRLLEKMSKEQARLTATYAYLFRTCQERGWFNTYFDPDAAAVFIQAYTMGKIVDDVAPQPVDPQAWEGLIMQIVTKVFLAPGSVATAPVSPKS